MRSIAFETRVVILRHRWQSILAFSKSKFVASNFASNLGRGAPGRTRSLHQGIPPRVEALIDGLYQELAAVTNHPQIRRPMKQHGIICQDDKGNGFLLAQQVYVVICNKNWPGEKHWKSGSVSPCSSLGVVHVLKPGNSLRISIPVRLRTVVFGEMHKCTTLRSCIVVCPHEIFCPLERRAQLCLA